MILKPQENNRDSVLRADSLLYRESLIVFLLLSYSTVSVGVISPTAHCQAHSEHESVHNDHPSSG